MAKLGFPPPKDFYHCRACRKYHWHDSEIGRRHATLAVQNHRLRWNPLKKLYVIKLNNGNIGVVRASNKSDARRWAISDLRERWGRNWREYVDIVSITLATPEEESWVRGMGGHIHTAY